MVWEGERSKGPGVAKVTMGSHPKPPVPRPHGAAHCPTPSRPLCAPSRPPHPEIISRQELLSGHA